jgi:PAS domain S-box-containing protein
MCAVVRNQSNTDSESLLLAPIIVEGEMAGALLLSGKAGRFNEHDEQTSRAFAEFIALALRDRKLRAERDAAANAAEASEKRLREILERIHLAAILLDREGRVTFCNDFLLEITGWDRREVLGQNYFDRFSRPADREESKALFADFVGGGESTLYVESEVVARSGETRHVAWYCTIMRDHGGAVVGAAGIGKDTTARLRAEAALRSSEARFRHVVENSPEAIVIQTDGRFAYVNPAAIRLFGAVSEADLLGCSVLDRFHPDLHDSIRRRIQTLNDERVPVAAAIQRIIHPGGRIVDAEVSAVPFEYDGKHGALVFLLDVTERRKARELEEQLAQAQRLESIGKLAGGVAHDFNNLLTVINGYSDVSLRRLTADDPLHSSLSEIRKAGEKAALLTQQLLAFSRRQLVHPVNLDLNDVISDMELMIRRTIGEHISVVIHLAPRLGAVTIDPGQVTQVLMNLVVNARDAMQAGGALVIETSSVHLAAGDLQPFAEVAPGPYVRLIVRDTGVGIPPEILPRIFEPFFTTKGPGEGTGLGLSTVYGIVKQAGGHVRVESSPGGGTAFSIYLPETMGAAVAAAPAVQDSAILRGSETILLVEDQDEVRKLTRDVLRSLGYKVVACASPVDAVAVAVRQRQLFDLVITDMVMPGMSGRDLVKVLAAEKPDLKWLYISGYTETMGLDRGELFAEDSFLPKPFSPDQLARRVRHLLGERDRAPVVLLNGQEPVVRQLLAAILRDDGYEVVDNLLAPKRADVVVVDVGAAPAAGQMKSLTDAHPGARVVALSATFSGDLPSLARRFGVHECLAKPVSPADLLAAVKRVIQPRESNSCDRNT